MNPITAIDMYNAGKMTVHECALWIIDAATSAAIASAIQTCPNAVRLELKRFVDTYREDRMLSLYGDVPSPAQVALVREILERNRGSDTGDPVQVKE